MCIRSHERLPVLETFSHSLPVIFPGGRKSHQEGVGFRSEAIPYSLRNFRGGVKGLFGFLGVLLLHFREG